MALYHVQHLVLEGVFVRHPDLRIVISEHGLSWLPFLLWRLDMSWRESRPDVPWLVEPPSEYVRRHMRFTSQPLEESPDPQDIIRLLKTVDAQDLILFSSDYPHYDFDRPDETLKRFPAEWREKVAFDNAWEWYRLAERLHPEGSALGVAAGT
jgi:predicted TIM-barrel fold metal-dependent hydrolase